jgi:hypothetical protein
MYRLFSAHEYEQIKRELFAEFAQLHKEYKDVYFGVLSYILCIGNKILLKLTSQIEQKIIENKKIKILFKLKSRIEVDEYKLIEYKSILNPQKNNPQKNNPQKNNPQKNNPQKNNYKNVTKEILKIFLELFYMYIENKDYSYFGMCDAPDMFILRYWIPQLYHEYISGYKKYFYYSHIEINNNIFRNWDIIKNYKSDNVHLSIYKNYLLKNFRYNSETINNKKMSIMKNNFKKHDILAKYLLLNLYVHKIKIE